MATSEHVNVVFVAPFLMKATLQFVAGVAGLEKVRLVLLTQEPLESVPRELRARLLLHRRLQNALDADQIAVELRRLQNEIGPIHCLLGTLEHLQVPLAEVRAKLGIDGMGPETARNFREKSRMKRVLRAHAIPCARHRLAGRAEEAIAFAQAVKFPIVAKPPAGAGSRETFQLDSMDDLRRYLATADFTVDHPMLFEEFVSGDEYTFDSAMINGRLAWHSIVRYFPTPLHVLKNPWIQWCLILPREVDHPRFDDIRATAASALRALGMVTGFSHLEWFRRSDDTIAVSEVGARPPGGQITSMHGYAHDFDIHGAWARLVVFGEFDPPPRRYAAGCVFLRGQGHGRVRAVQGLQRIAEELGPLVMETKLPQLGQPGSGTYEGEGYIILRHPETAVIERALDRVLATIRIVLG